MQCRLITLIIALLFSPFIFANKILLRSMQVENNPQKMVMTFHLSGETHYRSFMLHNPTRYVIDLKNVKPVRPLRLSVTSSMPIRSFKYAAHSKDIFRMVFQLKNNHAPSVRIIPSGPHHQPRLQFVFAKTAMAVRSVQKIKKVPQQIAVENSAEKSIEASMDDSLHFKQVVSHEAIQQKTNQKQKQKQKQKTIDTVTQPVVSETADEHATNHREIIIVIDPGHGGKDPGATGPGGTHEKNIVLSISKLIQKQINAQPGYRALLTRTGDYYLTLRQRLAVARHDKADMFVAIHADTWRNKNARGVSIFALSQKGATSEAARWLATRENASELMGGVDLQDKSHLLKSVLINLSQSATIRSSLEIGQDVMQSVRPLARLHHNRVEQAAFVVLKSPDIPSLLIETGFLSNTVEEQKLRSNRYQAKLAYAIKSGICDYFASYPPRGTWLSYWRNHPRLAHNRKTQSGT